MKSVFVLCCVVVFLALTGSHAAPFQDLNFDSANTNTIFDSSGAGDYAGPITDLMPGWSVGGYRFVGYDRTQAGLGYDTIASTTFRDAFPVVGFYSFAMLP